MSDRTLQRARGRRRLTRGRLFALVLGLVVAAVFLVRFADEPRGPRRLRRRSGAREVLVHRVYEGLVGVVAGVLTNRPRDQVATETSIEGPLDNPKTSTWELIVSLVRNAFFEAILPGLRRETTISR